LFHVVAVGYHAVDVSAGRQNKSFTPPWRRTINSPHGRDELWKRKNHFNCSTQITHKSANKNTTKAQLC